MPTKKLIVVIGATGKQGQTTIKSLLHKGYAIRAFVRNPDKFNKLIRHEDIEVFKGNLKDIKSLTHLFQGTFGLYFALPLTKNAVAFGKNILDLAKVSNLKHIIFSSVGGADRYIKVDHFLDKIEVEDYLKSINKPYTILRPVGYMETFAYPKSIKTITGLLRLFISESKKFQLISVEDIGAFASIAFDNPEKYIGREIEIAGDELTLNELFEKIEKVAKSKVTPYKFPNFIKSLIPKFIKQMLIFYAEDGWQANIQKLKTEHKSLMNFGDWLNKNNLY